MTGASLSLDKSIPWHVPMGFFALAPLFALGAGIHLCAIDGSVVESRANFPVLAQVHLIAVGFLLQVMFGALLQLIPVALGGRVPCARILGPTLNVAVTCGAVLLASGFASVNPSLLRLGVAVLAPTLASFVLIAFVSLWDSPAVGPTIRTLRLALIGLACTGAIGLTMAAALAWGLPVPIAKLRSVHVAWGLVGWGLMLVAAVSYLVVPMFQLTPTYPARYSRQLGPLLFASVATWSALAFRPIAPVPEHLVRLMAMILAASYCVMTLYLQSRRRRKVSDATVWFFRFAMVSGSAAAIGHVGLTGLPGPAAPGAEFAVGVLALVGFLVSVVTGMLYKIVPFITWLHLASIVATPPATARIVPERNRQAQFFLHLGATLALICMPVLPGLQVAAGGLFALSNALLAWNMMKALLLVGRLRREHSTSAAS